MQVNFLCKRGFGHKGFTLEMIILKKKHLSILTSIYIILVFAFIVIWGFTTQDANGLIYPSEQRGTLWSFVGLLLIGVILAGIGFAGVRDNSTTVNKKTVIAGFTFGFGFLIWRILMSLT